MLGGQPDHAIFIWRPMTKEIIVAWPVNSSKVNGMAYNMLGGASMTPAISSARPPILAPSLIGRAGFNGMAARCARAREMPA